MSNPFDQFDSVGAGASANPFDQFDSGSPAKKPKSGIVRGIADLGLGFVSGAVGASKAIADAAGAGNSVSSALNNANEGITSYLSDSAKADQREQSRIMQDAEGKGVWEGIKAGAKAFAVAPAQTAVSGLGSVVPMLVGSAATALTGGSAPVALAAGAGLGAAMGSGTVKGAIFDEVKKRGLESGMNDTDATNAATKAQAYGGDNAGNIALGAGLGMADAATGVTKAASNIVRNAIIKPVVSDAVKAAEHGVVRRVATGIAGEMPLEAAQGGQERYAANVAAQRAGYDVDPWAGVASQATLESLASAGPGAAFGAFNGSKYAESKRNPPAGDATADAPSIAGLLPAPGPYTGTPGDQIIANDAERQAAIDAADANAAAIYAARDEFERQLRQSVTIINEPAPLQQRIDEMLNVDPETLHGIERTRYEKALARAFNEPIGIRHDENQREVPFTMGEYLDAQVAAEDVARARPLKQNARQQGNSRLQQLADEEVASQPDIAPAGIASLPSIPVIGPLSAAANVAVQSGVSALAQAQQVAEQMAQQKPAEQAPASTNPLTAAMAVPSSMVTPKSEPAPFVRQDGTDAFVPDYGMSIVHGSGNSGMTDKDIQIVRTNGQKQGKKGRTYGGFYGTSEADSAQAEGYANMMGGQSTLYDVRVRPGTKILNKTGDITRLSEKYINELVSQGYGLVVGTDPRGRTEYAVIDKSAIDSMSKRSLPVATNQPAAMSSSQQGANFESKSFADALQRISLPGGLSVQTERNSYDGGFTGRLNIMQDGAKVGHVDFNFNHESGEVTINKSEIAESLRGKGIAKAVYSKINATLREKGLPALGSDPKNMTKHALNLWKSLVKSGAASARSDGRNGYQFNNNQPDTAPVAKQDKAPAIDKKAVAELQNRGVEVSAPQQAKPDQQTAQNAANSASTVAQNEAPKQKRPLSVGVMPGAAEPITVQNGVVYIGKYPAQNFDTGEDVTVPAGATDRQVVTALKDAGAIAGKMRVFGLEKEAVTDTIGWTSMTTVQREGLLIRAGYGGTGNRRLNLGGAGLLNKAWEAIGEGARNKIAAAHEAQFKQPEKKKEEERPEKSDIDAAAHEAATSPKNDTPTPTEAQIEAGNYKKGHITLQGLNITIENPEGSKRSGTDEDGKAWEATMAAHYGYIKRTEGNDGDHVDVYVGNDPESDIAFIVDQSNADGSFDEHKVLLGFPNALSATRAYAKSYEPGWMASRVIAAEKLTVSELKDWLKNGDMSKPYSSKKADQPSAETVTAPEQSEASQELKTNSYSDIENKLINGEINVEDFMAATGLTDEDVGFLTSNDLNQKADNAAKEESPYFAAIKKLSAAIFKEMEGLSRGSTAPSRRAYDANLAKYKAAQDTLNVIAKNFEHPFRNTLIAKLPPFLESRYGKQWDGIEYGDKAKKAYRKDSYRKWVDLLIEAARNKNASVDAVSQPKTDAAPEAKQEQAPAITPQHVENGEAETATAAVVEQSLKKGAANSPLDLRQERDLLLKKVDAAIAAAPTAEEKDAWNRVEQRIDLTNNMHVADTIGYRIFDVPGDGKFKVLNLKEALQRFRDRVESNPGFKKSVNTTGLQKVALWQRTTSGGTEAMTKELLEDGEYSAAVEYAKQIGKPLVFGQYQDGSVITVYTEAKPFEREGYDDFKMVSARNPQGSDKVAWAVIDLNSGLTISSQHPTRLKAIAETNKALEKMTPEQLATGIKSAKANNSWLVGTQDELEARWLENVDKREAEARAEQAHRRGLRSHRGMISDATGKPVEEAGKPAAQNTVATTQETDDQRYQRVKNTPPGQRSQADVDFANAHKAKLNERAQAAEKAAQQAKDETLNDTDGFAESAGKNAALQQKIRNALNMTVSVNGEHMRRKETIRKSVNGGATIGVREGQRALINSDGTHRLESQLTKTGIDYAEYLIAKRDEKPAALKIGDAAQLMNIDVILAKTVSASDGVLYELFNANSLKDGRAVIRRTDIDSGGVIGIRSYNDYDQAEAEFNKAGSIASSTVDSKNEPKSEKLVGSRRNPEKVNIFNPYEDGDIVSIGGKEWQIRNDGGWYLTSNGNWRGEHPMIKKISAMTDLIAMVEKEVLAANDSEKSGKPSPLELTPKQYHDARLKWIAERNGVPLSEVRESYDTDAGRKESEIEWVDAVRQAFKDGVSLNRQMLDKLHEIRPGAVQSFMHDYPEAKIPDGYQTPEARKVERKNAEKPPKIETTGEMHQSLKKAGYERGTLPMNNREIRVGLNMDAPFSDQRFEAVINKRGDKWSISEVETPELKSEGMIEAMAKFRADLAALNNGEWPSNPAEQKAGTADAGEELTYNKRNRRAGGVKWDDIKDKNAALRVKEVNKAKVYPKPDYRAMVDGGMKDVVANIVKQAYDAIAPKPKLKRGAEASDEALQSYIAGVNRVMDGVMKWANDAAAVAKWAATQSKLAGRTINISELAAASTLLDTVYPNGWKANRDELIMLGGNKLLGALQPGYDEVGRAMRDIKLGWPASVESWQKQGMKVVHVDTLTVDLYSSPARPNRAAYVSGMLSVGKQRIDTFVLNGTDNKEDTVVQEIVADRKRELEGKYVLLDKSSRPLGVFESEEVATESAREKAKKETSEKISEKGVSVEMAERVGVEHRLPGDDVTSERLMETFGFRGVNFGNWMQGDTKAKVAERQLHLNHLYDAFMDLAQLLNLPPKAMSLNGMLGIAVGAQGSGKALAHFVPGVNEINVTRTKGAGALAHEWGHALDHYFATMGGLDRKADPYLSAHVGTMDGRVVDGKYVRAPVDLANVRPEVAAQFQSIVEAMTKRKETKDEYEDRLKSEKTYAVRLVAEEIKKITDAIEKAKDSWGTPELIAKMRGFSERISNLDYGDGRVSVYGGDVPSVVAELDAEYQTASGTPLPNVAALGYYSDRYKVISGLLESSEKWEPATVRTDYDKASSAADAKRKQYWSTKLEMFARAFDAYVVDSLAEKDGKNSYLAGIEAVAPQGDERKAIGKAFDFLFAELKTKETERGTAVYNIAGNDALSPADKAIYGMAAEGKSAAEILKFIASASRNPFNRQVAKLLLKTGIAPKVMAGTSDGWRFNAGNDKKYAAAYNEKTDTIALFRPAAAERNFVHEAIHAATLRALGRKGLAAGQMKALFAHVQKTGKLKGMYGMSDVDEFIAEAFSNPKFQAALKQVAAPKASGALSSAWNWFVRIVRGILGLPANQDNALSQALEIGIGVMRENMRLNGDPQNGNVRGMPDNTTASGRGNNAPAPEADIGEAKHVSAARQMLEAMDDETYDYGLRVLPDDFTDQIKPGYSLPSSFVWEDGDITEDEIDGVSTAGIRRADIESVIAAMKNLGVTGKNGPNGYYFGGRVVLVRGERNGTGQDVGETIIRAPEVVGEWKKPTKGLSEVEPNESSASAGSGADIRYNIADEGWSVAEPSKMDAATIVGDSGRKYDQRQREFFKNVGREISPKGMIERTREYLQNDFWKKMAVGIVDQFRGLRDLNDGGQAYLLARMSKGTAGAFETLLHHGKLSIKDGVYDGDRSGGFIERLGVPLHGELDDFLWFVAANRAERLAKHERENLFSAEDIAAGKSLSNGNTDFDYTIQTGPRKGQVSRNRAEVYGDALRVFNEFQKNTLDIAEQSGLIDGDSRKFWESEFYVPFYRVSEEDGEFIGAKMGKSLVRQQAFKKLKGGTDRLNSDLLSNTLLNWSHLIEASAKNRAAKASLVAAEQAGAAHIAEPGEKKTVWFMDGGQKVEYKVDDPFVMTAITSLEYAGMRNGIMDVMTKFKHWLTIGVTASPAFKVRNLIRDSIQAIGTSELGYNPITNVSEGFSQTKRDSQEYVSALASGGLIRFGTMLEGSESSRIRKLIKTGVKDSSILDSEPKWRQFYDKYLEPGIAAYNELGNRSEEINRAALYNQLIKQGKSHAEAALMARDLMDFSMQGSFNTIRFLTQIVPFMNARLQGMYKLGRSAKDNPRKLAIVTGAVALASIALMLGYDDDDDWRRREDWDRDNFWWFKFGGIEFRIPKPFEVGAVGTLAERSIEYLINDEMTGERFRKVVGSLVSNNLSMSPVPQLFKPVLDLYANKDSFTGRPIESMGMQRLDPEERYNSNTSLVARGLSTATGGAASPVQYDHLARAYFGWLGSFVIGGADMAARFVSDVPEKPTQDYWKFATQGIAREEGTGSSRYVTMIYEQAKELEQAHATHRRMIKDGRIDEARDYAAENKDKLMRYKQVESVKRIESQFNERIHAIERSDIDPDEKKTRIENINKMKEAAAKRLSPGYG